MRSVNWSVGGPTATERHLLADVRLLDGVTLVVSPVPMRDARTRTQNIDRRRHRTRPIGGYLRAGQRTRTPIGDSGCAASGSAAGTTGIRSPQSWRGVSGRRWILPGIARFEDQDLTEAEFRECDLTGARLIGVVMRDAVIDGLVSNLVVNGVEVMSYVEAGLDRRHRVRRLIRSADPAGLREAFGQLRAGWAATLGRLEGDARGVGAPARRRRVVGGADPAPSGVRARLVVPPLLPGIGRAVHADRAGVRVRRGPARAGPGPGGGPEPGGGAGRARGAGRRAGALAVGRDAR